jgi:hypothetical protein
VDSLLFSNCGHKLAAVINNEIVIWQIPRSNTYRYFQPAEEDAFFDPKPGTLVNIANIPQFSQGEIPGRAFRSSKLPLMGSSFGSSATSRIHRIKSKLTMVDICSQHIPSTLHDLPSVLFICEKHWMNNIYHKWRGVVLRYPNFYGHNQAKWLVNSMGDWTNLRTVPHLEDHRWWGTKYGSGI